MPKALRAVIDNMRRDYHAQRLIATPRASRKKNVQAAYFTKAEIQDFLNQLLPDENVMVHLIRLPNPNNDISIAMVGHKGRDMSFSKSTGGAVIATAIEGIYSELPCPPDCKDDNAGIYIIN